MKAYLKLFVSVMLSVCMIFELMSSHSKTDADELLNIAEGGKIHIIANEDTDTDNATDTDKDAQYVYTGSEVEPCAEVSYGDTVLEENVDYTVSYEDNVNAGTAKVVVTGMDSYDGTLEKEFVIEPKDISDDDMDIDDSNLSGDFEFNGKDRTPIVTLKYNDMTLNPMADYTIEYTDNFYPGEAAITITGIDNYQGEITRTFTITKKEIDNVTIRTFFDSSNQLVITVNNGSYAMTKDVDYSYTVSTDSQGNITITFKGLGDNYTGTCVRTISAEDNPNRPVTPTVKKAAVKKVKILKTTKVVKNKKTGKKEKVPLKWKKAKIKWTKVSGATGYQVRYSTKKTLKKSAVKTVKNNTKRYIILKKLKRKKLYYVQVRAYIVYNGTTYYGDWSKTKTIARVS